jgi:hypothetical protein
MCELMLKLNNSTGRADAILHNNLVFGTAGVE